MPNPDGSATLEELANFVLKKEAEPTAIGVEQVVTPEQTQLMQADIAAQGGQVPGPAEIIPPGLEQPTLEGVRQKFLSGDPMTQAEIDMFTGAVNKPAGLPGLFIGESVKQLLGKTVASLAAPGLGAAAGGAIGSMILPGPGTALGAAVGSLAGTEFNMRVGLEEDSDINRVLSFLAPQLGTFASRAARSVAKASPAGQALRSEFARGIARELPEQVLKAPGKLAVDQAFNKVRQLPSTVDFSEFGSALDALADLDTKFGNKIIDKIRGAGPEAKAAINRILRPKAPAAAGPDARLPLFREAGQRRTIQEVAEQAQDTKRFDIEAGDVLEIRKAVKAAKDAAFRQKGFGKVAAKRQAQELSDLSNLIDDTIRSAADAGNPGAQAILEANQLARVQFAQNDLGELFTQAKKTRTLGDRAVQEFDINKIDTQLGQAREANAAGEAHRFGDFVKTLDELGQTESFTKGLKELRRLSPTNNPQLFGQSFGLLTRAAQLGGQVTGLNLLGEVMLNDVARNTFLKFIRVTNGRFSIPILATAAAVGRAATGQPLDAASEKIINKLITEKQVISEQEAAQLSEPPVTDISGFRPGPELPPTGRQEFFPAGPIFGAGRQQ